jgi:ribosomal protein L21E
MISKKTPWIVLGILILIGLMLAYIFKPMTMNDIYKEPNFSGVVTAVFDKAIIVSVNEGEDELLSSDKVSVSLNVKLKNSMTQFEIGDNVKVFYDGVIAESYPAQINAVYVILLLDE